MRCLTDRDEVDRHRPNVASMTINEVLAPMEKKIKSANQYIDLKTRQPLLKKSSNQMSFEPGDFIKVDSGDEGDDEPGLLSEKFENTCIVQSHTESGLELIPALQVPDALRGAGECTGKTNDVGCLWVLEEAQSVVGRE